MLADLATLVLTFGADLVGGGVAALGLIGQMGPRALTSKELKPSSSSIRVEALNNCGKVWCCKKNGNVFISFYLTRALNVNY